MMAITMATISNQILVLAGQPASKEKSTWCEMKHSLVISQTFKATY
jgi:hypothetical protein